MINYFVFGGCRSLDYGLQLNKVDTLSAPAREVEVKNIPGRSGELLIDKERFGPQVVTYEAFFKCARGERAAYARRIKSWLLGTPGYRELADTYDRQYYRLARYSGALDIEAVGRRFGKLNLTFSCQPFRLRQDGRALRELPLESTVYNPEDWPSKPYFKLYGDGEIRLAVGGRVWQFSGVSGYIEVDSDIMETHKDLLPQNSKKTGDSYPELTPGWNLVKTTGATKIEMIPRWCTL
ncbi:hypothetical protein AAK917_10105 [Oscillospiraceae bacterium 52-8]